MTGRSGVCEFIAAVIAFTLAASVARADPIELRQSNLKPQADSIEAGIWGLSDKAELHAKNSAESDKDPALNNYVRGVVCKIASDYCNELRVYVMDRPPFNAFCAPNGYVEVNSGLLLRARSEDELAYVLGHEVTHFARSHSLIMYKKNKNTQNLMLALTLGVTAGAEVAMYSSASSGAPSSSQTITSISNTAQSLNDLIYLVGISSLFAYSREQEAEADALGFDRAVAAGYRKGAGASIWTEVMAEAQASDFPRVRKSESRASIFTTHPITADRIAALSAMGGASEPPSIDDQKRYRASIRSHLAVWLKDDLRRRDFGQSLYVIDRLTEPGEDLGILYFYRGEAHRQRRADGDAAAAMSDYQRSVTYPDSPPAAWRELGEALRKSGDRMGAAAALQTYLAKAPEADDRWLVEASLKTLEGGKME